MSQVRSWLACEAAYEEIRCTLEKRVGGDKVNAQEYQVLESIDRFCALLMQMLMMIPKSKEQEHLYRQFIDRFWLQRIREKPPLLVYARQLWPQLGVFLSKIPDEAIPIDIVAVGQSATADIRAAKARDVVM